MKLKHSKNIIFLGFIFIIALFMPLGIPSVTNPAPALSEASAQSTAAPENRLDPAKIKTWPKSPL